MTEQPADEHEREVLAKYSTPALRTNVLTEFAKRWQLWGKGIKGREADEIIEKLYR